MSARNEPTEITTIGPECFTNGTVICYKGENYTRQPQQVTMAEELRTLEDPATILMDYCGHPYQWGEGLDGSEGWMAPHDQSPITSNHLWRLAPLTVLHVVGKS